MLKQPTIAAVQKVQVEDIQISKVGSTTAINSYKGSKGQKVKVEDIQICNDGVDDIQIGIDESITAINGYKFK